MSIRTIKVLGFLTIAVLAATAGYFARQATNDGTAAQTPRNNPKLALATLSTMNLPSSKGQLYSLSHWDGKVRVVNYWATWCAPCREEMPEFSALQNKYTAHGVQFVGISIDSIDKVQAFEAKSPVAYPLLLGNMATMELAAGLGNPSQGLPFTLLLNRQGELDSVKLGRYPAAELESRLQRLLEK